MGALSWTAALAVALTFAEGAAGQDRAPERAQLTEPTADRPLPDAAFDEPLERRYSPELMAGGIAATGTGLLVVIGGMLATASGTCGFGLGPKDCTPDDTMTDVGTGLIVGGALVAAAGAVLTIAGGTETAPAGRSALAPTVQFGPTGGSLTWSF